MSGPVVISGLACHFAPETRVQSNGEPATRYIGGKCLIDWPRPEGGKAYICETRRLRPAGAWRNRAVADGPGPAVVIKQRKADYEQGASYEIRMRHKECRHWTFARVDFPAGVTEFCWPFEERTAAYPLARTANLILLLIIAEREKLYSDVPYGVQVEYHLTGLGQAAGVKAGGIPTLAGLDGWGDLLIGKADKLDKATEYEIKLTIDTGAITKGPLSNAAYARMLENAVASKRPVGRHFVHREQHKTLTLTTRTLAE